MAYIGNIPAESYASFETETFSVSATASYTLSHAVTNENEIRLVINGVVQQPGSGKAYTASGTTLTLTSATVSGDVMYAVYLGRALQTVNPPNASVGNSQTAPTIITGQTAETSIATDDTILIHDTSASALRKMTRANFVSGIGGTNTPAFQATMSGNQSYSNATSTKVDFDTEQFDTAGAYDHSTNQRFTVPSGQAGKYFIFAKIFFNDAASTDKNHKIHIYKNGSNAGTGSKRTVGTTGRDMTVEACQMYDLSVGDYIEIYLNSNAGAGSINGSANNDIFGGYKIIE